MSEPRRKTGSPRILTIANQKGGVGKTTTAINLGAALASIGEACLIVDLDPQGNASTGLGIDLESRSISTYDLLIGEATLAQTIRKTIVPRLDLAPATMDLLGLELEIGQEEDRNFRLRKGIDDHLARPSSSAVYRYILIDCPPSLNLLTINAMAAADAILVPLQCEFFALEGLTQLLQSVEDVRKTLNPDLHIQGVALTMYDGRNKLAAQVVEDVRSNLGDTVYETVIPRNVRLSEAPSHGMPALLYDVKCAGSQAYVKLAAEIIRRERGLKAA